MWASLDATPSSFHLIALTRVLAATIKIQSLMQSNFLLSDQQDFRFPRCCNLIVAKHFEWRYEWNCMSHIYFSLAQIRNIKLNVSHVNGSKVAGCEVAAVTRPDICNRREKYVQKRVLYPVLQVFVCSFCINSLLQFGVTRERLASFY